MKKLVFASALAALMFVTVGCSSGFKAAGSGGSNSLASTGGGGGESAGLLAFQNGLYAFTQTQGCVACHAAAVEPYFASSNIDTAYQQAETLVSFTNPTASMFIVYSGNNHCSVAACEATTNPATVTTLLQTWATAEIDDGGGTGTGSSGPAYATATIALPTTIPTLTAGGNPAIINFQLSALTPAVPALSNAIFQIEAQMDNATTYKFENPRIGGNTSAVTISGIHIYIRPSGTTTGIGTEGVAPANLWDAVSMATAAVFNITTKTPTTAIGATPLTTGDDYVQMLSSADSITIGFDTITTAAAAMTTAGN